MQSMSKKRTSSEMKDNDNYMVSKSSSGIDNVLDNEKDFDESILATQTEQTGKKDDDDDFDFIEEEDQVDVQNQQSQPSLNSNKNSLNKQNTLTSQNSIEEKIDREKSSRISELKKDEQAHEKDNFKNLKLKTSESDLIPAKQQNNSSSQNKQLDAKTKEINNILSSLMSEDTTTFATKIHNDSHISKTDDNEKDIGNLDETVKIEVDEVQMMQMLKGLYGDKLTNYNDDSNHTLENEQRKKDEDEYNKVLGGLPNYSFMISKYVEYPDSFFN